MRIVWPWPVRTDTVKELQHIQDCERGLVQTWKYFSRSPLKTAKLHEIQAADIDSSKRKLVKTCRTRCLSHGEAMQNYQLCTLLLIILLLQKKIAQQWVFFT